MAIIQISRPKSQTVKTADHIIGALPKKNSKGEWEVSPVSSKELASRIRKSRRDIATGRAKLKTWAEIREETRLRYGI